MAVPVICLYRCDAAVCLPKTIRSQKGMSLKKIIIPVITIVLGFAWSTPVTAASMSRSDYNAAEKTIESDFKSAKEKCDLFAGDAKDACLNEAETYYGK